MNTSRAIQCRGKRRHRSARHARLALAQTALHNGDLGMNVYRCPHCDFWHVGHPEKREQKKLHYQRLLKLIERANAH